MEHLGSDNLLLFSTDYPHWQFDGEEVLPPGLGEATIKRMLVENALDAYPRLKLGAGGETACSEETVS
jgi:hypothetical protein